jgi:hypothetical protein
MTATKYLLNAFMVNLKENGLKKVRKDNMYEQVTCGVIFQRLELTI